LRGDNTHGSLYGKLERFRICLGSENPGRVEYELEIDSGESRSHCSRRGRTAWR
jgi:hypothetical protein